MCRRVFQSLRKPAAGKCNTDHTKYKYKIHRNKNSNANTANLEVFQIHPENLEIHERNILMATKLRGDVFQSLPRQLEATLITPRVQIATLTHHTFDSFEKTNRLLLVDLLAL